MFTKTVSICIKEHVRHEFLKLSQLANVGVPRILLIVKRSEVGGRSDYYSFKEIERESLLRL